jgi:hypothetical protein
MSNKNNNNTTNLKCTNFVGNTCLDWLLYKKEWLQYAQNLGVEEIITKGTYGGVDFKSLRSPFKSETTVLSIWINKQVLLKRPAILEGYTKALIEDYPWLPYTLNRMVIPVGQTVTRQSTMVHYLPGLIETSQAAQQLPFPCIFYRSGPIDPENTTNYPVLSGANDAPRMSNLQISEIAQNITDVKINVLSKTTMQLDLQMAGDPTVPNSTITFDQLLHLYLPTIGLKQAFLESRDSTNVSNMAAASTYGDRVKACGVHFSKLPQNRRDEVSEFIAVDDYHGAYQHLNIHFLQLGAGNIAPFEEECKRYRLQPGQMVREHLDLQVQAFKRLAQTLYLEQRLAENNLPLTEIEIPDRISIHNSGELTDAQIIAAGGSVLIPEARRFNWILESIAHSPRFKSIADHFASADLNSKRINDLIRMINNKDLSNTGQAELREEWVTNPNYAKEIANYIITVKKDSGFAAVETQANASHTKSKKRDRDTTTSNSTTSATTSSNSKPTCDYHPNVHSHWTRDCRLNPNPQPKSPPPKNDRSAKKSYYKGEPCQWCKNIERLKMNAPNHSTRRCKINPANKSNAEANMADLDDDAPDKAPKSKKGKYVHFDKFLEQYPDWTPDT